MRRIAEPVALDQPWVEKLRKDFLVLLRNTDRVKTYADLTKFRQAVNTFRKNFDHLLFDSFLNKLEKREPDTAWLNRKLRGVAWTLSINLSVPGGYPDEYTTEAGCLARFQQEAPKWKARLQRYARAFWTEMGDVIDWYQSKQTGLTVHVPSREQLELEGFKVTLVGYDIGYRSEDVLDDLKMGLRHYRARAAKVAPILLRSQVPLIVDFEARLDKGGTYGNGLITLYATSALGHKLGWKWVSHVIAHEMGHHLYRSYLSESAQSFWSQTIRGDLGELDLEELLAKWPGNAWAYDFSREMTDDPILALQVEGLSQSDYKKVQTKEEFQALYDKGVRKIPVPKTPITGYANKNSEEAFCEALGLLVAFGPSALHERVRWWLQTVLGNDVRVSHTYDRRFVI